MYSVQIDSGSIELYSWKPHSTKKKKGQQNQEIGKSINVRKRKPEDHESSKWHLEIGNIYWSICSRLEVSLYSKIDQWVDLINELENAPIQ